MTRAQSVRGGGPKPQPLNLGRAAFDRQAGSAGEPRRMGTQRSASERPQPTRVDSVRSRSDRDYKPRARNSEDDIIDDYYEDEDPMSNARGSRSTYTRSKQGRRPAYIEEEDEDEYDGSDVDDAEFEMMSRTKSRRRSPARSTRSSASTRRLNGKIKVKVHANDTRYVFLTPDQTIRDFWQSIRDKFGMRSNFKVEIKDDGDMITMADQDDLEMAIQSAKSQARKEGSDMPKMEVRSIQHIAFFRSFANTSRRFGSKKYRRTRYPSITHCLRGTSCTLCFGNFLVWSILCSPAFFPLLVLSVCGNVSEHTHSALFCVNLPFTAGLLMCIRVFSNPGEAGWVSACMYEMDKIANKPRASLCVYLRACACACALQRLLD